MIFLAKGDTKQAIRDLTDAVNVLDPQPSPIVHLALAQAAAKDTPSARASLRKAKELKLNPDDLSPLDRKRLRGTRRTTEKAKLVGPHRGEGYK